MTLYHQVASISLIMGMTSAVPAAWFYTQALANGRTPSRWCGYGVLVTITSFIGMFLLQALPDGGQGALALSVTGCLLATTGTWTARKTPALHTAFWAAAVTLGMTGASLATGLSNGTGAAFMGVAIMMAAGHTMLTTGARPTHRGQWKAVLFGVNTGTAGAALFGIYRITDATA